MMELLLEARNCKNVGYFREYIVKKELTQDNELDFSTKFKFGFINANTRKEFLVPNIQTIGGEILIHSYRDLKFKPKDQIKFQNRIYNVQSVNTEFEQYGTVVVKHYYITLR